MSDLLTQLRSIKDQLARDGVVKLDPESRREAAELAHKIGLDIENPGKLIDRILYQVGSRQELSIQF